MYINSGQTVIKKLIVFRDKAPFGEGSGMPCGCLLYTSIINKFKEYNIELNDEEAKGILEMVRAASVRLKRTLFDKELVKLYQEYKRLKKENHKEN